jgi:hypothetical protein
LFGVGALPITWKNWASPAQLALIRKPILTPHVNNLKVVGPLTIGSIRDQRFAPTI